MSYSPEDLKKMFDEIVGSTISDMRKQNEELAEEVRRLREQGIKSDVEKMLADYEADRARRFGKDKSQLGLGFAKAAKLLANSKGDLDRAKKDADAANDREAGALVEKMIAETTKAMGTQLLEDGGAVMPVGDTEEFIELLRDRTAFRRAGARSVPLAGTLPIPGAAAAGTFGYYGENENLTHTAPKYRAMTLVERYAGGTVATSNQLLRSSSPRASEFIREDMLAGVSLLEDITFFRSAGGEHKPKGIRELMDATHKFTRTQAGAASTIAEIVKDLAKLMRLVKTSNVPMLSPAYVMTDREHIGLGTMLTANDIPVFPELLKGYSLWGIPVLTTNQIPDDLTVDGTDNSEVYFGDFAQALIGDGERIAIAVSDTAAYHDGSAVQSAFSRNQTVMRVTVSHDMNVRHEKAFAMAEGVDWGADLA